VEPVALAKYADLGVSAEVAIPVVGIAFVQPRLSR
jgi:hypothetical protein